MEFEAVDEGTIGKILVPEGTEGVKVNSPIATLAGRWRRRVARRPPRQRPTPRPKRRQEAPKPAAARAKRDACAAPAPQRRRSPADPDIARRHRDGHHDGARSACATPWPRRCAAIRTVFLMGEEVARISGRLQGQPGPAARNSATARVIDTPDHRTWLCRPGRRRGVRRPEADCRIHDLEFRHAGDGPDHQLRRQDALHVGRPDELPHRVPRPQRRRRPRRRPAQPGLFAPGMPRCPA